MHHLILGYGYCGYYLAQELLQNGQQVTAVSRHLDPEYQLPQLNHCIHDLHQPLTWKDDETIIYYLIPPPSQGERDSFLQQFLSKNSIKAKKIIYFGSSGVYGDHQGAWVNELSACNPSNSRQLRRLDAEDQWLIYCKKNGIQPVLLRIAGIYGPCRLPVEAARAQTPLIEESIAPYINHIYVRDLARVAWLFSQHPAPETLYNVADGNPQPMGALQQMVALALGINQAPYESWQQVWERSSLMKREFLQSSKRLIIDRLKSSLANQLSITSLNSAIEQCLIEEEHNKAQ